ncbi:MAG: STAS domain-containing protein [Armatimonadetes bacterium]|nr:STAS domain-containing protein [Armatimonadota bacterium]
MTTETVEISTVWDGSTATITAGGALDLTNSAEFSEGLKNASETADSVVVDLRPAFFVDTAVIQDLARAAKVLLGRDRRLKVIVTEEGYPLRVLRIVGFTVLMDIEIEPADD